MTESEMYNLYFYLWQTVWLVMVFSEPCWTACGSDWLSEGSGCVLSLGSGSDGVEVAAGDGLTSEVAAAPEGLLSDLSRACVTLEGAPSLGFRLAKRRRL